MEQASNVIAFPKVADDAQGITSWYVCVFADGEELRAEVSCPIGIEGGFFTGFSKRIIVLGDGGTGIGPIRKGKPGGDVIEFDIPVTRK